ncbi:hypothetical protein J6590_066390 [Homalodisca vitripennis]|nr:hypothetical protein J6590_066390 [Homalodisca vitripennis]
MVSWSPRNVASPGKIEWVSRPGHLGNGSYVAWPAGLHAMSRLQGRLNGSLGPVTWAMGQHPCYISTYQQYKLRQHLENNINCVVPTLHGQLVSTQCRVSRED